jgi:hypothetical protein
LRGDNQTPAPLSTHGYSGTAYVIYWWGPIDPSTVDPSSATASAFINGGLENVRIFTDPTDVTVYTEACTNNRVWQIARMLCDKRWGYRFDYSRLSLDSWIDAATWCDEYVRFTDTFGTNWDHYRALSNVDLNGRKVQQQIDDICLAGRLSRPFIFNGKIHIMPLRELTTDELAACPVFTDEGDSPNVVFDEPEQGVFKIDAQDRPAKVGTGPAKPHRVHVRLVGERLSRDAARTGRGHRRPAAGRPRHRRQRKNRTLKNTACSASPKRHRR